VSLTFVISLHQHTIDTGINIAVNITVNVGCRNYILNLIMYAFLPIL
jgi:hypothetical protein